MPAHQTDFATGRVGRSILEVALPMAAAQMINLLYNIVDRIFIGRMPGTGTLALSGVGLCFPIIMMVAAFSQLFGSGGAPLCAIARGKGDHEEAEKIMGSCFALLTATGLTLTVFGVAFHRPLLYLFGASDATFPFASDYLTIYLLGTVAIMINLGMNPFISGQGFARTGMLTVAIGAVANLILDPIFIFTLRMGVRGAAVATILSQFLSCAWTLRFLTGRTTELRLQTRSMRLSLRRVKKIVSLGVTGFVMGLTTSLVQIVCNATLQAFGDTYIGIMAIVTSVREICSLPMMSLTSGAAPFISYNYGAGQYARVRQAIKFITVASISITVAIWALVFFFPTFFIRIFNDDAELLRLGVPALHTYFFGFFLMALQFVGQTVFTSLGKAKRAVFFSLFRKVVIVVPLTLLLPRLWGLGSHGVFLAEPVSNLIGGTACFVTMLLTVLPELRRGGDEQPGSHVTRASQASK